MAYSILWRIHAILMGSSFAAMLTGVIVSLAFRTTKKTFQTHRKLGIYAGISGIAALLLAFIMVQIYSGYHFTSLHTIAGGITGVLIIITPLAGHGISKAVKKKQLRIVHIILGFITLAGMLITILLGLSLIGLIAF